MTSRVLQSIVVISMLDMSMFMTYFSILSTNSSLNQIVILQHIWLFHLNELHWSSPSTRYGNKLTSAAAIHSLTDLVQFEWPVLLISNIFLFITKIKFCYEGWGWSKLNILTYHLIHFFQENIFVATLNTTHAVPYFEIIVNEISV